MVRSIRPPSAAFHTHTHTHTHTAFAGEANKGGPRDDDDDDTAAVVVVHCDGKKKKACITHTESHKAKGDDEDAPH